MLKDYLSIGIIQTVLDPEASWDTKFRLKSCIAEHSWQEIKQGFKFFRLESPQIIVIPELSLGVGYEEKLRNLAKSLGTVVIAGVDFVVEDNFIQNRAIVVVPPKWPVKHPFGRTSSFHFGKTYFSYMERKAFKDSTPPYIELPEPNIYILDAGDYGKIGVAICSDFFDLERFVVYKGRIHHLIVIAHNKDIPSYYHLAETIGRIVYCNVIICNSGFYGGSIAFSPYKQSEKRYIYKHEGFKLFTSQIVQVPVNSLDVAQKLDYSDSHEKLIFKATPPGYKRHKY